MPQNQNAMMEALERTPEQYLDEGKCGFEMLLLVAPRVVTESGQKAQSNAMEPSPSVRCCAQIYETQRCKKRCKAAR